MYVITGFNKYGMANSMLSAQIIKDTIMGITNPYAFVVTPSRHYITSNLFKFIFNMCENVYYIGKQFIGIPLKTVNSIKPNSGDVIIYRGIKRAVYKDSENKLHTFSSRCSHFNCQIKWNPTANCFECPCHGSRYDVHGKVIYEPACFNKKEKEYKKK
jgi:nitrite reductase/ring-hydroxylating ferredoxin subunit